MNIKSNIKGDSSLTDSGFRRCQKFILEKNRIALEELEEHSTMELLKRRYDLNAKTPKRKVSLWKTIKGWLGYV